MGQLLFTSGFVFRTNTYEVPIKGAYVGMPFDSDAYAQGAYVGMPWSCRVHRMKHKILDEDMKIHLETRFS